MAFGGVMRVALYGVDACLLACFLGVLPLYATVYPQQSTSDAATTRLNGSLVERLSKPLKDFTMTEFGPREGAPSEVATIAQTPDGFLWLGCEDGLVRFDGVTFDRSFGKQLPQQEIKSLWVDPDGSLWIGYVAGGVSRLRQGQVTNFNRGLPRHTVWSMVRDANGVLWAATTHGIYSLEGNTWSRIGVRQGYDGDSYLLSMGLLSNGTLWIDSAKKAWLKNPGSHRFVVVSVNKLLELIYQVDIGSDSTGARADLRKILSDLYTDPQFTNIGVIRDASGAIWSAVEPALVHFRWITAASGRKELSVDSLTRSGTSYGDMVTSFFQDREGNVWAGELGGILQFRPNKLSAVAGHESILAPAISSDGNGGVWIGSDQNDGVIDVRGDVETPWPSLNGATMSITTGRDGAAWFLSQEAFNTRYKGASYIHAVQAGSVRNIAYPAGVDPSSAVGIAANPQGGYLLSSSPNNYRLRDGVWTPGFGVPGLPTDPPLRFIPDENGNLWLTYSDNRISVIGKSGVKNYTTANGLSLGSILALSVKRADIWVVGTNGVEHLIGDRFVPLHAMGDVSFESADGIVQTDQGDLWVNASAGLFKITKKEIHLAETDPKYEVNFQLFDQNDGLRGGAVGIRPGPSLVESGGRIWVARSQGVSWLDPVHIMRNEVAPIAEVVSIASDEVLHDVAPSPRFPPLVHAVRLVYTAASLTRPDKLNFRYKLDGTDPAWITVGDRRATTYTDLGPGTHRFEVEVENEDGVWSVQPATASFTIAPAVYQTWWFRLSCTVALLLVVWLLYAWRLRQLQGRLRQRLEAVHDERERIARELHDTLMQSAYGLVLKIRSWAEDRRDREVVHEEMSRAAEMAGDMVTEGRDRIRALRAPLRIFGDLTAHIKQAGNERFALSKTQFLVLQQGRNRELQPETAGQLIEVGVEAMRNAAVHAKASRIEVLVAYRKRDLDLLIRDDGVGIPDAILHAGGKPGHWGLIGMRERIAAIGGELQISRCSSGGTEVRVSVPARRVYTTAWARLRSTIKGSPLD